MKNTLKCLAPISCLLWSLSSPSFSLDFRQPVQISGNTASGSLQVARNSYDQTQRIGCRVDVNEAQTAINCMAATESGDVLSCSRTQPDKKFLRPVYSISDISYIEFTKNSAGQCIDIKVINGGNTH